jgi:lipooligosaccharide transport system permease protein
MADTVRIQCPRCHLQLRRQRGPDASVPARGSFFPLDGFPEWAQVLAAFNPLHQCVVLVRGVVFGFEGWQDLARVGYLALYGIVIWRIAIHAMTRKLID